MKSTKKFEIKYHRQAAQGKVNVNELYIPNVYHSGNCDRTDSLQTSWKNISTDTAVALAAETSAVFLHFALSGKHLI